MILTCNQCQTRFQIPDDKIPAQGTAVRCAACQATYWLFRNGIMRPHDLRHSPPTLSSAQLAALSEKNAPSGSFAAAPLPPALKHSPSLSQSNLPAAPLPFLPPTPSQSSLAAPLPFLPPTPSQPSLAASPLFSPTPSPPALAPYALSQPSLQDGDGLPNSEESWFDVPASLLQKKVEQFSSAANKKASIQNNQPLTPKDSWLELPLEDILSAASNLPPNQPSLAISSQAPKGAKDKDSWFEVPTLSPQPTRPNPSSAQLQTFSEPPHFSPERHQTLSSGQLNTYTTKQPNTLSSGQLDVPPPAPRSSSILGLGEEEGGSQNNRLPNEDDPDEKLLSSAMQASLETPLTPPPPALKNRPSPNQNIEFFLPDRIQQRKQFWMIALPIVTRSSAILILLSFFFWLWGSLLAGEFSKDQLAFARMTELFWQEKRGWRFEGITMRSFLHSPSKKPILLLGGTLVNTSSRPQFPPKLQLIRAQHPSLPLSPPLPCCLRLQPPQFTTLQNNRQIQTLYQAALPPQKKIPPRGRVRFHFPWSPPQNLHDLRLRIVAFQTSRPRTAKPAKAKKR